MTQASVMEKLKERFQAPLPEFYQRRIVFWQDEEGAFAQEVEELELKDVKIIKLTGSNNFNVKRTLLETDPDSDYLVYNPLVYEDMADNWLLDVELYSETFRADYLSLLMEEMDLPSTPGLRRTMKAYERFFKNRERREKMAALAETVSNGDELELAVMTVLTGAQNPRPASVITAVLMQGLEKEAHPALQSMEKFGRLEAFWEMVSRHTGYMEEEEKPLKQLAAHLLITALSQTIHESSLKGLEAYISYPHRAFCYALVHDWMHSDGDEALYHLCREVEETLDLVNRFDQMEIGDYINSEGFPCINECILRRFLQEIGEHVIKVEEIIDTVEKRRTLKWYKRVQYYYEGILQVAWMQQFYQAHITGLQAADVQNLWNAYIQDYYRMDTYYRGFHLAFSKGLKRSNTVLDDLYKGVAEYVEGLYKQWYLNQLGSLWTELAQPMLEEKGWLQGISRQQDFYATQVQPVVDEGNRVFIIVSDALRYEVAAQLSEELGMDGRGKRTMEARQGIFPTTTKYGMAALLPHKKMEADLEGRVLVDGMPTEGTKAREKVLQKACADSVAIGYKDFIAMRKADRRHATTGMKVVYLYHNTIDAVGDKAATEDDVFEACDDAVAEIKNLVRIISNDLSGTTVVITADHGFIYTYHPLAESEKAEKSFLTGEVREPGRRYALAVKESSAEHMVRIPMMVESEEELVGYAPRNYLRIKQQGGGQRFVHGGISLQEIVVPVLTYKSIRKASKQYREVTNAPVMLVSESRKVSNSLFALDFYQKEPVGGNVQPAEYEVYMADINGQPVSDRQRIIADKTSQQGSDRMFRLRFSLRSMEFSKTESYYMVMVDRKTQEVLERMEFQIDITFTSDFGF